MLLPCASILLVATDGGNMDKHNVSFVNDDTSLNDEKLENEFKLIKEANGFSIPTGGIYDLTLPVLAILIYLASWLVHMLNLENNQLLYSCLFSFCIIAIVLLIVLPLFLNGNSKQKEARTKCDKLQGSIYNEVWLKKIKNTNDVCRRCLEIKKGNILNAYNLYTYDQILQIEESVGLYPGEDKKVFSYSTYRDDGEDVGISEAEKIIEINKRKKVEYFEFFYFDANGQNSQHNDKDNFINLTTLLGQENVEKCLDNQFYKHSRFDIMIYQWSAEKIEGYFCLNFPSVVECDLSYNCPLNCTLANADRTKNIFYKKMPRSITIGLHNRLLHLIDVEKGDVHE